MNYEQTPAPETKKRRGCFFYGCLSTIVIVVLVGVLAVLAVRALIHSFTDSNAMQLPKVEMPTAEYEALHKRVVAFKESLDKPTEVAPLILTGDEINALIAYETNTTELKDKFYISIEGDKITGKLSIPLGGSRIPFTKGRFLNGSGAFQTSLANGVLIVTADSIMVNSKPFPEVFMAGLRNENLAKEVYRDPKNAETLRKLESIEVKEGKIIIKPRTNP